MQNLLLGQLADPDTGVVLARLELRDTGLVLHKFDAYGDRVSKLELDAAQIDSQMFVVTGLNAGPQAEVLITPNYATMFAWDAAGGPGGVRAGLGGVIGFDQYGAHLDNQGGPDSPTIRTSADWADAAPDAIPASSARQFLFLGNSVAGDVPTSGDVTLFDVDNAVSIGPINWDDDDVAVQAAFDAAYGAGEVTVIGVSTPDGFELDFDPGTLANVRLSELTFSANTLGGLTNPLYAYVGLGQGGKWGKALGLSAAPGSIYQRNNAGTGELWVKTGTADTAWTQVTIP